MNIQIAAPHPRVGGLLHHQEIVLFAGRGAAPAISGQRAAPGPYAGAASGRHNPRPTKEIQRMEHTSPAAPKNHLMWAILSIFGGFWPFGIVATVYANRTSSLLAAGQIGPATVASRKALRWMIASFVTLPLCVLLLVGYALILRAAG
ncbi:CD225/dispanin family protein [Stenotrophomonas maltophilia]|uniref:CD225/dispanin family protein n=1 Tax=Stenotrophomonas maltophilia TaxID=40324 RepID=UPI0013DBA46E|nr:CD225/dispanin family protein [Stenotrophomonas maltophilia]